MPATIQVHVEQPTLRERNKREKLQRIRKAARTLFETNGYEGTTIRDVAKLADVGQGTVFFYAPGKRELVFLVVNEEHASLLDSAFVGIEPEASLLDQLMFAFGNAFRFLLGQGVIGRFMLRELTFDPVADLPPQEATFNANRVRFMKAIKELIEQGMVRGEVRSDTDAAWAVRVIFALFRSETRIAVSSADPSLDDGIAALRRSLTMVLTGILA